MPSQLPFGKFHPTVIHYLANPDKYVVDRLFVGIIINLFPKLMEDREIHEFVNWLNLVYTIQEMILDKEEYLKTVK